MRKQLALRGFHILLLIAIFFAIEGARLAWLQLLSGGAHAASRSLNQSAVRQHSDDLVIDDGRGQFRDRNGQLLTGLTVNSLVAFPSNGMPRGTEKQMLILADSLGAELGILERWLKELREPEVWKAADSTRAYPLTKQQIHAVERLNLQGVAVLPYLNRYSGDFAPLHAIGYISQHPDQVRSIYGKQLTNKQMKLTNLIGGSGLEKSLDRWIQGLAPVTVKQVTDAARRPLEGLGLRMTASSNTHFPIQVTTTVDMGMQHVVEQVLNKYGIKKGAAVVLDAANADIRAMVSLPRLDPYHIGAKGTDERNHALTAAPPGSVFKTVTLAAALESGVTNWKETFRCNGHYGKYGLKCWKEGGHGLLTLEQAYAQSCNVAFAQLAERLDPAWLQITAERMGLGRQVGWHTDKFIDGQPLRLFGEEEKGTIFLNKQNARDGGVRTGTGIGQRDVRATPLQVANMAVTILHDGQVLSPRIVKEVRYADGGLMAEMKMQSAESKYGQIKPLTAALLRQGMRSVVQEGTAKNALSSSAWPLAGKSGTAELAGKHKARNDQWFVGYGPVAGKPRYAIAVLIEDQPAGLRNRGAVVFGAIMDGLRLQELRSQ